MPTCDACGEELSPTSALTCSKCGQDYCRSHYHDHDCSPAEDGGDTDEATSETESGDRQSPREIAVVLGYALGILLGLGGLRYFLDHFELILYGSRGVDAIQALVSLGIAASFFSFATFVLVGSYILSRG